MSVSDLASERAKRSDRDRAVLAYVEIRDALRRPWSCWEDLPQECSLKGQLLIENVILETYRVNRP